MIWTLFAVPSSKYKGDTIDIFPCCYKWKSHSGGAFGDEIDRLVEVDPLTVKLLRNKHVAVYPASHYVTTEKKMNIAVERHWSRTRWTAS